MADADVGADVCADVAADVAARCPPRRGRPLDAAVEKAILKAALALLEECGYDKLTMKDLAERAGTGLGAIYRRWPTKCAVVIAALQADEARAAPLGLTGDATEDLTRALVRMVNRIDHSITSCVSAMRHDEDLAAAVRDAFIVPRRKSLIEIFAREFDDPAECETRAEMALAVLIFRLLVGTPLPKPREIREQLVPVLMAHH